MKILFLFCLTFLLPFFLQAQIPEDRRNYVCYMKVGELKIDGRLDESSWNALPWSDHFVDIEGSHKSPPVHETKMKMLWDEDNLYIGIHMVEPHIWATFTVRESVIFHENDIEVFLDPDGDTHNYYELEVNALGTEWDLLLTKPYRNGGKAINGWNINGFKKAIHLEGSLNDPRDKDEFWSIEMVIPWKSLSQSGPNFTAPKDGEQWRINFSRVQWQIEGENKDYRKKINPVTGKPFPEDNWVWSPMGMIDMHLPNRWGFLQFTETKAGEENISFVAHPDEPVKDALRVLYDLQKQYFLEHGAFALTLDELQIQEIGLQEVNFEISASRFKISSPSYVDDKTWNITEDGRIWKN